jgi:hypothetical protein
MHVTIDLAHADRLVVAAGVLGAMRPSLQGAIDVALAALLDGQEPPAEAMLAARLLTGWLPLRLR